MVVSPWTRGGHQGVTATGMSRASRMGLGARPRGSSSRLVRGAGHSRAPLRKSGPYFAQSDLKMHRSCPPVHHRRARGHGSRCLRSWFRGLTGWFYHERARRLPLALWAIYPRADPDCNGKFRGLMPALESIRKVEQLSCTGQAKALTCRRYCRRASTGAACRMQVGLRWSG